MKEMILRKESVDAVGIRVRNELIKIIALDGRTVDISAWVMARMSKWRQLHDGDCEAGGFLTGYINGNTGNIIIDGMSEPYNKLDYRTPTRFDMRDPRHKIFLHQGKKKKTSYLGVWHTHPEQIPIPSDRDMTDWRETVRKDKSGCNCFFFIIIGIDQMRIWLGRKGPSNESLITEVFEEENEDGLYKNG